MNASNQSRIKAENYCLDFKCSVILNDRSFLRRHLNDIMMIYRLISPFLVRGVNNKMLRTSKYVMIYVCIDVIDFEQFITARFLTEIYLVNDLIVNLLFVTDVIISQQIILNFKNRVIYINICNVTVFIDVVTRKNLNIKRTMRMRKIFVVIFNQTANVSIIYQRFNRKTYLFKDRKYFFESQCSQYLNDENDMFVHLIDLFFFFVQVHNISSYSVKLFKQVKLRTFVEYDLQKCYLIISKETSKSSHEWLSKRIMKDWKFKIIKLVAIAVYIVVNLNSELISSTQINSLFTLNIQIIIDFNLKHIYINDVIIYDDSFVIFVIEAVVNEYQNFFVDKRITVNIFKDQWMFINLKTKITFKSIKIYLLK